MHDQIVTWVDIVAGSLLLISAVLIAFGAANAKKVQSGLTVNPYMAATGIAFLTMPVGFVFLAESIGASAPGEDVWAQYAACVIFALTVVPTLRSIIEDVHARRRDKPKPPRKRTGPVDAHAEASRARMFERTRIMHTDWQDRLVMNWTDDMVPSLLTPTGTGKVLAAAAAARRTLSEYEQDPEPSKLHEYRSAVLTFRQSVEAAEWDATQHARKNVPFGPESPLDRRGKLNLMLDGFSGVTNEEGQAAV
ncbi:hypothetical protein LG293_17175 (plasmid) [Citricoccus nitrophenolicus]